MTWGSPRASLYVKCVGTVRAASHPPVWIHRKCELLSLKKMLNGLCLDDDYCRAGHTQYRSQGYNIYIRIAVVTPPGHQPI